MSIMSDVWRDHVKRTLDIKPEPTPLNASPLLYLAWTQRYAEYLKARAEAWHKMKDAAIVDEACEWALAAVSECERRARYEAEAWVRDIVKTAEMSAIDHEDSAAPLGLVSMRDIDRLLVMENAEGDVHRVRITSDNGTHGWECMMCPQQESGYATPADASADAGYHGVVV